MPEASRNFHPGSFDHSPERQPWMTSLPADVEQTIAGFRRSTLLLIDQFKIMREGMEELVKRTGEFEVIGECGTATEAVHVFRTRRADVIVVGSRLLDVDGIQATRLLLREFPTARIVLLSGHADEEAVFRTIRSGAFGFVLEKSSSSHLLDALRAVAGNRSYIDPNVSEVLVKSIRRQGLEEQGRGATALSCRELEVLTLLVQGKTGKEIAVRLNVGVETVRSHRKKMMKKLDVSNVARLINAAFSAGLIQRPDGVSDLTRQNWHAAQPAAT
jgi:DNA-binding NarL/FixJ family response regulator